MRKFWQMVKANNICYLLFYGQPSTQCFLYFLETWNLQNFCYLVIYFSYFRFPQFPHFVFYLKFEPGELIERHVRQTIIVYFAKTMLIE